MLIGDDLDLQKAYRRIIIASAPIGALCISVYLIYVWLAFLTLFKIPIGCIPYFFGTPLGLTNPLGILWRIEIKNFFVGLYISPFTYPIVLFRVNTTMEFVLLALFFVTFALLLIRWPVNFLIFRLAKEAEFSTLMVTFRSWRLPPSNRYKTYGEAKNRIRQIIKNGSIKEKSAVFMMYACGFLFFIFLVVYLFNLSGILPISLSFNFVLISVLLFLLFCQWFVWKTIR